MTEVQILDEAVCISHSTNTLGKGVHPTILSPDMGKWSGRLDFLTLVWKPVWEKENFEIKLVVHHLKIDLVSHSTI